jgi:hypothetical protein
LKIPSLESINTTLVTRGSAERVTAKSANPNFAAAMANYWARAEEVVYVFSGLIEQLPLSQTHWERILDNIQDQALVLQIKGDPSPEYKYSKFSKLSDKGFLGVASPEQAVLIVQAVSRITIGGVRPRKLYAIKDTRHAHARGALIFVALIVKILSCNKKKKIHGL